ncbi:MAG: type-F conjugative transfer system protein TraW [Alphaproteobacteria bacterium]|jgi:conjugal transfer pilus assembly protein TraW
MRRSFVFLFLTIPFMDADAKSLGKQGAVFPIKEESLIDVIQSRLMAAQKEGKIEKLNQEFAKRVKESALNPKPVEGLSKATFPRSFYYDPSLRIEQDIKDHEGRFIAKKGTVLNPLDYLSWGEPLLLIDGLDEEQLQWSLTQKGKVVFVSGSSIEAEGRLKRPIYFDQAGKITSKFSIRCVPARISQSGKRLKIEELVLNHTTGKG